MESASFAQFIQEKLGFLPEITGSEKDKEVLVKYVQEQEAKTNLRKKELKDQIDELLITKEKLDVCIDTVAAVEEIAGISPNVPGDIISLASLAKISVHPMEKNQLELHKGLVRMAREMDKNEIDHAAAVNIEEDKENLEKATDAFSAVLSIGQENLAKLDTKTGKTTDGVKKEIQRLKQMSSSKRTVRSNVPDEIRYDKIVERYNKVMEQIDRVEALNKNGPLIGDIPVGSARETSRYLDLLKKKKAELELEVEREADQIANPYA